MSAYSKMPSRAEYFQAVESRKSSQRSCWSHERDESFRGIKLLESIDLSDGEVDNVVPITLDPESSENVCPNNLIFSIWTAGNPSWFMLDWTKYSGCSR